MVNERVYDKLKEVAKRGTIPITYTELNDECNLGIKFEGDAGRKEIGIILGDISKREFQNNRPLISAVVVSKNSHPPKPSDGFYNLARELGLLKRGEKEEIFYSKELTKVFEYWKNK